MGSLSSSADINNAGCESGPHEPRDTAAERELMRGERTSNATQQRSEHVVDRLIHQLSGEDHAQEIRAQVDMFPAILEPPPNTDTDPNTSTNTDTNANTNTNSSV